MLNSVETFGVTMFTEAPAQTGGQRRGQGEGTQVAHCCGVRDGEARRAGRCGHAGTQLVKGPSRVTRSLWGGQEEGHSSWPPGCRAPLSGAGCDHSCLCHRPVQIGVTAGMNTGAIATLIRCLLVSTVTLMCFHVSCLYRSWEQKGIPVVGGSSQPPALVGQ